MPAMADGDGAEPDPDDGNGTSLEFNAAAWSPANREYGLFYLMVIRQGLEPEKLTKPAEVEHLKFVDNLTLQKSMSSSTKSRRYKDTEDASEDESDDVSEGMPHEESDVAPWTGKLSSWWRVHASLGENLVVRAGLSLASAELLRIKPGEVVQQAGAARMLRHGTGQFSRQAGCIRLPVKPRGWVTADATRAGGPRYLVSANAPRWRVIYSSPNSSEGDAIVRSDVELDADEVAVLYNGDVVEQAGPSETRGQGIVRMPVTVVIQHRKDGEDDVSNRKSVDVSSSKVFGWVTIDASPAGGPVFFKPAPDQESPRRQRRRGEGGKSAG